MPTPLVLQKGNIGLAEQSENPDRPVAIFCKSMPLTTCEYSPVAAFGQSNVLLQKCISTHSAELRVCDSLADFSGITEGEPPLSGFYNPIG